MVDIEFLRIRVPNVEDLIFSYQVRTKYLQYLVSYSIGFKFAYKIFCDIHSQAAIGKDRCNRISHFK